MKAARDFAPGSIANLGPGYDVIGLGYERRRRHRNCDARRRQGNPYPFRRLGGDPAGGRVVAILTGQILKERDLFLRYHQKRDPSPPGANRPVEIEPTLSAVADVLEEACAG